LRTCPFCSWATAACTPSPRHSPRCPMNCTPPSASSFVSCTRARPVRSVQRPPGQPAVAAVFTTPRKLRSIQLRECFACRGQLCASWLVAAVSGLKRGERERERGNAPRWRRARARSWRPVLWGDPGGSVAPPAHQQRPGTRWSGWTRECDSCPPPATIPAPATTSLSHSAAAHAGCVHHGRGTGE